MLRGLFSPPLHLLLVVVVVVVVLLPCLHTASATVVFQALLVLSDPGSTAYDFAVFVFCVLLHILIPSISLSLCIIEGIGTNNIFLNLL